MSRCGTFAMIASVSIGVGAWAARAEMRTDRPDQTESSGDVSPGNVQLETGFSYERDGSEKALGGPDTLLRVGLVERLELRFGWDGWRYEDARAVDAADGHGDGAFGAKLSLADGRGRWPETALLGMVSLPFGDAAFSNDHVEPEVRVNMSAPLSERVSLGWNVGAAWVEEGEGRGRQFVWIGTLAAGLALSERAGLFVEYFAEIHDDRWSDGAHAVDGGFTFLIRPGLQADAAAGVGLTDEAVDWFVSAGLSVLFSP